VLKIFTSDKRKHKTLSAKLDIIRKLDKGEKLIDLAKECGVGRAKICDIRKNRQKIECFVKNTHNLINLFRLFPVIRRFR
jgi:hypothetical protein